MEEVGGCVIGLAYVRVPYLEIFERIIAYFTIVA